MRFTNFYYLRTYDDIKNFFKENKKALDYLEEFDGIDNMLGAGVAGRVWKIKGKELTLKITSDPGEIEVAKKLVGKNLKTFLKIYGSVEVGNVQLRIQEMCYPLTDEEEDKLPVYDQVVQSQGKTYKEVLDYLRKTYLPPRDKEGERIGILFFLNIINDAQKLGLSKEQIEELDVHTGNIMKTKDGNLKLVDF